MMPVNVAGLEPLNYESYQGLIFDMDGTLVDSVDQHDRVWSEVLKAYHIPFSAQRMVALGGVPSLQTVEILCDEAGIQIDCLEVATAKEQRFIEMGFDGLQLTPLMAVVNHYVGLKPMAIGTGANSSEAKSILTHFGILELFDVLVCADMVLRPKPKPDTFIQCALKLDCEPSQCIVFEDADGGLAAAKEAGMATVDVRKLWTPDRLFT